MKRFFTVFLLFAVCFASFATFNGIVVSTPTFMFENYPLVSFGSGTGNNLRNNVSNDNWYETYQDIYYRYYDHEGLLDLGIEMQEDHFAFAVDVDLRQTSKSYFTKTLYSNIPYLGNDLNAILDMNFPRTAYGEIFFDKFFLSVGRRPIGWGPGNHDFAISTDVPFEDHIWFDYKTNLKKSSLDYNFVVMSFNSEAIDNKTAEEVLDNIEGEAYDKIDEYRGIKTLIAHKVGFLWSNFRFSIGELNMVYGEYPNLVDFNPFGIYHNLFQDRKSNVMGYIEMEGLLNFGDAGKARIYGSFAMDDFDLPGEGENGKPGALGMSAGVQYHILDGAESKVMASNSEKYALNAESFKFNDGLNVSYEFYFCTPYMYNRFSDEGKFTVPHKLYNAGKTLREANAFYIGFKYGPNSIFHELRVEYSAEKVKADLGVGLLIRGDAYGIDSAYGQDAVDAGVVDYDYRYKLYGNHITTLIVDGSFKWIYADGLQLQVGATGAYDITDKAFACSVTIANKVDFVGL